MTVVCEQDGFLYVRDEDGLLQAWKEDPNGTFKWKGKRWSLDHYCEEQEALKVDPIGEIGYGLGLVMCPYHHIWLKPGEPCPVCLDEALEQYRAEVKDELGIQEREQDRGVAA